MAILGTTAIEDQKFIELAGNAANGIVYPLATGFDAGSSDPQVVRFVKEFNLLPSFRDAVSDLGMLVARKA